ncbi:MAG: carboxymuconolactone decarboxylase [Flavobacteriaceae bacterium]|nr:MAG: carboxymuconolactone decarboxylase [Flavobacteriaceae bacterium]
MERITHPQLPKEMLSHLMAMETYLNTTFKDLQLLELMRLRVAQINKCGYCIDMHYKELKHTGETQLRINMLSVWKETSFFSEKEKVVLAFTESLTEIAHHEISDAMYQQLTVHFSIDEICNLTAAIAQINTWTRLVRTFKFTPGNYKVIKN